MTVPWPPYHNNNRFLITVKHLLRFHRVSKLWDCLKILQSHCCQAAVNIQITWEKLTYQSCAFETFWDLMIRSLRDKWIEALVYVVKQHIDTGVSLSFLTKSYTNPKVIWTTQYQYLTQILCLRSRAYEILWNLKIRFIVHHFKG